MFLEGLLGTCFRSGGGLKNHVPGRPSGNMILGASLESFGGLLGLPGSFWWASKRFLGGSGWPPGATGGPGRLETSKCRVVFLPLGPLVGRAWGVLGLAGGPPGGLRALWGRVVPSCSDPKGLRGRLGASGSGQSENAKLFRNLQRIKQFCSPVAVLGSPSEQFLRISWQASRELPGSSSSASSGLFRCLLRAVLGPLGSLAGASWGPLRGLLGPLGDLWGPPGGFLGPRARKIRSDPPSGPLLGAVLGLSWAVFEAS